ncbi:MAG: serine hydrolase, partial [Melioribacteraceae bacterium]|nr:serine hydrolase [Melioribacteraceae bacterium]
DKFENLKNKYVPISFQNLSYNYNKPEQLYDGWEVSDIANSGLDTVMIFGIVKDIMDGSFGEINSFQIVKDNKLILDEYFLSSGKNETHLLSSSTKSISSLILGSIVEKYKIDLQASIFKYLPEYEDLKSEESGKISLEDLLTMRLGYEKADSYFPGNVDIFKYTLDRKVIESPAQIFFYDNIAPNLIAPIVKNITKEYMDDYARDNVFNKMQIVEFDWEEGKQDGHPICQGSLKLRARDFAKFGYLVLNNGKWNGTKVVSKSWIDRSTKIHATVNQKDRVFYGYLWWIMEIENTRVIYSGGSGGQYCFIVPDHNMILSFTGNNFNNQKEYMLFDIVKMIVSCST